MLIKNLYSLIILPILLLLITKRPTVSVLFLALLFTLYSPDKSNRFYNPNVVYCPSSGKIMSISINGKNNTVRIAIFLNVYNNHTQYMPTDSKAVEINRIHGPNFPAYTVKSSHNEQLVTLLYNQNKDMYYRIYQMTGIIARRLKTMLKINHSYSTGDRLGFIFLGSRVDIELPLEKVKKILIRNNQTISSMEPIILLN
jgi:phosphatidylserine decarboxylase